MLVKFEIYKDDGNWCARAISADIFTQGKTLDRLMKNIEEAVELHFEDVLQREEIDIVSISELKVRCSANRSPPNEVALPNCASAQFVKAAGC